MKHTFILDGLNCANCAAKIEDKISKDSRFGNVSFSFATKKLVLTSDIKNVKQEITKIVDSIEDSVTVIENSGTIAHEHQHEHNNAGKNHKKLSIAMLITAAVLFVSALVFHILNIFPAAVIVMSVISAALAGYKVFINGVISVTKLRLDESTLMAIAVIAAMILGEFTEAAAVTVLFSIGELLEDYAVNKSRRDISKLANIREDNAVIENADGTLSTVPAESVDTGTQIVIKPYARVPLDCIVTSGESYVDASAITGESLPQSVSASSELLSGMVNGENMLKATTTKAYTDSTASRIIKLVEESAQNKGNSEKLISRFARIYTPVVIILAVIIAVVPGIITGDFSTWIYRSLVCLVSSCPCAIVISVPLAYFAGIGASSKSGVLIKGGKFIEALAKTNCIAFDKTGTLTTGKMKVTAIHPESTYTESDVLSIAASCELMSNHPVALAIKDEAQKRGLPITKLDKYIEKAGFGVTAEKGSTKYSCGGFEKTTKGTVVYIDDSMIGTITVSDSVRAQSAEVIKALKKQGIGDIVMLTGDNDQAAGEIAQACGVTEYHAGLLPQDKTALLKSKIDSGMVCGFVGDGINDAPVMAIADCGIAMGLGSDAAIESSDVVLSGSEITALPKAVGISRRTINTVKANIIFSLCIKAAVIALAAVGFAPMWIAVFADTGVSMLCVINSTRLLKAK